MLLYPPTGMITFKKYRWLIAFFFIITQMSALPLSALASAFDDVADTHPYAAAIETLRRLEIIHGFENAGGYPIFWPDQSITRAEFIAMVVRSLVPQTVIDACLSDEQLLSEYGGGLPFVDVRDNEWYNPFLCVAWSKNLVTGYADHTFRPDASIRFSEAAKILSVAFKLTDQNLPDLASFGKEWYIRYIRFLDTAKAIPPSIRGPDHRLTRAETAELLVRLIGENPPPSVIASLPEEEVLHPVRWITDERRDLGITFDYPDSWSTPHLLSRGNFERNRLPLTPPVWTIFFGPQRTCPGFNQCVERDFSLSNFRPADIPSTLQDLQTLEGITVLHDTTVNGLHTIVFDEITPQCTVRSALLITHDRMVRLALHCGSKLNDPWNALLELLARLHLQV